MSLTATPEAAPATGQFQKRLGLFDGTMLVAGAMIGSGIFIVSSEIGRDVGSSGGLLAVWILTGIMTIIGALSYAELAAMMPHAGGQYVYLREAFSPLWGFLYGWTLFLVIQTGTIAAVGVAFSKFLGVIVPALGTKPEAGAWQLWEWHIGSYSATITAGHVVAVAIIALLTSLNCLGVREGKWVQNIFTVTKTLALILLIVLGFTVATHAEAIAANMTDWWSGATSTAAFRKVESWSGLPALVVALMVGGGAMVGALFSSDAWNNITFTAGEVQNPRRNLPLSLVLGTGLVITLYVLTNIGYLRALPLHGEEHAATAMGRGIDHAQDDRVGTALAETISPTLGPAVVAIAVMVSTFGCANGLILMGARLYYAMARDGLFFRSVGQLNPRGVPAAGLILQGIWACLLVFSGTYGQLLDYVIFAALLFYVLTVIGLFVLRRTQPDAPRPYRAFGYPVVPGLYVGLAAIIMIDLLFVKPGYTWPGLIIVVAGIPVYFLWRRVAATKLES
ncbi:MAG TPA: amino acid permease [Gemmataceae bacterium]|nr:amino acid permease [Gemmataceae bacterium]